MTRFISVLCFLQAFVVVWLQMFRVVDAAAFIVNFSVAGLIFLFASSVSQERDNKKFEDAMDEWIAASRREGCDS